MAVSVAQRIGSRDEFYRIFKDSILSEIRVAIPGIIQSFNATEQTVTVQPALREQVKVENFTEQWVNLPLLLDVPIVIPRAGGYAITFPVKVGDECLVVFGDMCIDAWFSNGSVQNQIEMRRHDLSDAFAILGITSMPRKISNYNTSNLQIKSETGTACINISVNSIAMTGTVTVNGREI